ncbi:hypothetical protein, partial [Elongatibacter sediminis]
RYIYVRPLLILIFLPALSVADCQIELQEIKPRVNQILEPLHEKENSDITEEEFSQAEAQISAIISELDVCTGFYEEYERKNSDYTRWGEKSDRYRSYSLWLTSVDMQLEAAVESFRYWIFRSWLFDVDMWEKVAVEFDEREI